MPEANQNPDQTRGALARVVGVPGAVLMGLGSILGTGIFVSIGIAAGAAGPSVVLAAVLAALVATFNGLSSAALAASHPVSGGTYEYGHRYLNPSLGFVAGWMFLCAKSASAATAALGLAGYLLAAGGASGRSLRTGLALTSVALLTAVVAGGIKRSNRTNAIVVSITVAALLLLVFAGFPTLLESAASQFTPFLPADGLSGLLNGTALMFVAYTGYGRIATLGEEIRDPRRNIPRAVVAALLASMLLYVSTTAIAVATIGSHLLAETTAMGGAPLVLVAREIGIPAGAAIMTVAAVAAMVGVLLNLILGLSRVVLAMARRGDLPARLAEIDARHASPRSAVVATGCVVGALALLGDVRTTWSFSAFTVLIYYALTNLAALRLPRSARLVPRIVPALGLASCLSLAFWVETEIWIAGLALIAAGLAARRIGRSMTPV